MEADDIALLAEVGRGSERAFNRLIGLDFVPGFWGFLAMLAEFGGGLCLVAGIFFRPACAAILFTLLVAVISILNGGYGFSGIDDSVVWNETFATTPFFGPASAGSLNPAGAFGGVQVGYNQQLGSLVVGIEADLQGAMLHGRMPGVQQLCPPGPHFDIAMTSEYPDILPPLNAFNISAIALSRGIARGPAPELRY